ncbi:MAG: T9SS type A sorting domain-containing protein [Ignavibacterium sp.]|nr:MAG: T9SS type A sorting domain-containing protein [Ignavibacterium sp.]
MKINNNGDSLWFKTYPVDNFRSFLGRVSKTNSNDLIISGATSVDASSFEDGLILKVDQNGNLIWSKTIGGMGEDYISETHQLDDGSYISIGNTTSFGAGQRDLWLLKFTNDPTGVNEELLGNVDSFKLFQNYPNPFNPTTKIKYSIPSVGAYRNTPVQLKVYDLLGNEIATLVNEEKPAGTYDVEWDATGLPSGVYFYQLKTDRFVETKKMILIK